MGETRLAETNAPARSQSPSGWSQPEYKPLGLGGSPFPPSPNGLHAPRCVLPHPQCHGQGSPHLPASRQRAAGTQECPLSLALGALSPAAPCRHSFFSFLPFSLQEPNHRQPHTSSWSCRPGAWRSSWLSPPSHRPPQALASHFLIISHPPIPSPTSPSPVPDLAQASHLCLLFFPGPLTQTLPSSTAFTPTQGAFPKTCTPRRPGTRLNTLPSGTH